MRVLALLLALPIVTQGRSVRAQGTSQASASNPCALLTSDEIQALVPKEHVDAGVPTTIASLDSATCRYTWGLGTGSSSLVISVNPAARMFIGMNADSIKQLFVSSIVSETEDAAIPDVGQAAVFKAYSPAYVSATAYVKDRILQVALDRLDARDKKGEVISLLKSAASRL
jgi:hypothetical protein